MQNRKAGSMIGGIAMAICLALFATFSSIPRLADSLDNPHVTSNIVGCDNCHDNPAALDFDNQGDQTNGVCGQCHNPSLTATDVRTHASPTYGAIVQCTECHNPHAQNQSRVYKAASYVHTGTLSTALNAVQLTTLRLSAPLPAPPAGTESWVGFLIMPDKRYAAYIYRIAAYDPATNTITIDTGKSGSELVNTSMIKPGAGYAIVYGKLVKEYVRGRAVRFFRPEETNSFADGDGTYDGVCEVCHTLTDHFQNSGGAPDQHHTSLGSSAASTVCTVCHKHQVSFAATNAGCLGCHEGPVGSRAAVGRRFRASSHHVQGVEATNAHCYQCHWEADSDGSMNATYHGGSAAPGSPVDLVVYGAGARPTSYVLDTTAIQYTANGTRAEFQKINSHCTGCHSDQNNATQPFGDGKTPKQYAWDGTSVEARYGQAGTTPWGKYGGGNVTPKNTVTKAYSSHGNAINNQGGWDLNETWPNTRNGTVNVLCFDCHNSHGSIIWGNTASYTSATASGGILKETSAGKSGYPVTYLPQAGGSADTKNLRNPGASLCLDCHLTQTEGTTTPWGYQSIFGASQQVIGYLDSPYFGPGTFGSQQRYSYKISSHKGGHFGASSSLASTPSGTINGLCTPCHDPHGVSPTLGVNQQYGVPLLKGTWLTAPYQEDRAPANNTTSTVNEVNSGNAYHIDQNTFGAHIMDSVAGIAEADSQFAGLCLNCHSKNSLTDGANGGTWKSVDRIHESVKGWGANTKHNYPCSKCHTPHNSRLPRLMVSNCLNTRHKGRLANNASPLLSYSSRACDQYLIGDYRGCGGGGGGFPGSWSGDAYGSYSVTCHENQSADQSWNMKTSWGAPTAPVLIDEMDALCSACSVTLQWNASTNPEGNPVAYYVQVDDASDFSTLNYSSGWITGTSWTVGIVTNTKWHWRVQARDAVQTSYVSSWSTPDPFTLSDGIAPPQVALTSPANGSGFADYYCGGSPSIGFYWNAVQPLAEYYVQVSTDSTFTTVNYSSGWISTSWFASVAPGATYYWRVQARDTISYATGPWSSTWSFSVTDYGCISSCPFIYVWDGEKYQYVTDIQGSAIGYPPDFYLAQYVTMFQPMYIVLKGLKADGEGRYSIKLRETLAEISYVDEMRLLAVDYPEGYEIASSTAEGTYRHGYVNPFKLYTLKAPRLPISAADKNGADILAAVSEVEGNLAPEELNAFDFYTLDFGEIDPANAKLVIDGWSVYGNLYKTTLPKVQPYIEVMNGAGEWVKAKAFGVPAGDMKRMVVDISNLFLSDDHRIRVHTGADSGLAWRIDRLMLDDSAPVPLTVTMIGSADADLHYKGQAPHQVGNFDRRITADDGVLPDSPAAYGYGSFTRYGDVKALLDVTDDMFAIMRHGDEISLTFPGAGLPPVPPGMVRGLVLKADVYYKTFRVDNNVELLPFHSMSIYPYDRAVENYPADPAHEQYRQNYNTRMYSQ